MNEQISALIIYLILPVTGLLCFLRLRRKMETVKIPKAPIVELFIIFASYGGLLLVVLTALFLQWSGMASFGMFYLILGAPVVMGIIAFRHRRTKLISIYHKWTYLAAILYFVIAAVTFVMLYLWG
jgi:hypothetical protein